MVAVVVVMVMEVRVYKCNDSFATAKPRIHNPSSCGSMPMTRSMLTIPHAERSYSPSLHVSEVAFLTFGFLETRGTVAHRERARAHASSLCCF